jgi:colicin import membrane protein
MDRQGVAVEERQRSQLLQWLFVSLAIHGAMAAGVLFFPGGLSQKPGLWKDSYSVELVGPDEIRGPGLVVRASEGQSATGALQEARLQREFRRPEPKASKESKAKELLTLNSAKTKPEKTVEVLKVGPPSTTQNGQGTGKGPAKLVEAKVRPSGPVGSEPMRIDDKKKGKQEGSNQESLLSQALERVRASVVENSKKQSETLRQKEEQEKKIAQALERVRASVLDKGSPEGGRAIRVGVSGGGGTILKSPEFIAYYTMIDSLFKENWIWHGRKDLKVTFRFGIMPDGEISSLKIVESSKDRAFDLSALRAIEKVTPLPPPPTPEFSDVTWTFTPEGSGS